MKLYTAKWPKKIQTATKMHLQNYCKFYYSNFITVILNNFFLNFTIAMKSDEIKCKKSMNQVKYNLIQRNRLFLHIAKIIWRETYFVPKTQQN